MTGQRPRLALLDASHGEASTRRNFRRELAADLAEFDVTERQLPAGFDFDGVVVTGSSASVYWAEPWIAALLEWLETAIGRGLPTLGVCFGHQAVAEALGGRVEPMDDWEIGYRSITHTGDSRLFAGVDETFTAFTTHSDAVVSLPPGARRIAENDYGIHGFELDRVFAVQFHPEYDMQTAREIAAEKPLEADRLSAVLDDVTESNYAAACEAKGLFDNFLAVVDEVGAERATAD